MTHLLTSSSQVARLISRIRSPERPFIVVLAGPSGSGKTTEARRILQELHSLGVPIPTFKGKPFLVEMDMFYREESKSIADALGENYDHPAEIDVEEVEDFLDSLIEGKEAYYPVYDFKTGRRKGREGPVTAKANPVIVVEGIYAIGLLSHRSNLNVFVDTRSRMELLARRLIRDISRTERSMTDIVNITLTAMAMWNVYGESQRKLADVILKSSYSIVEEKGQPSFQIKIPASVFEELLPITARKLFSQDPVRVEDVVIGEEDEQMRGRLYFDRIVPSRFELSYRSLYPSDLPYTKSLKIDLPRETYSAFIKLSQIMGYKPRVFFREIRFLKENSDTFKWYRERNIVEIETPEQRKMEAFVHRFRGHIRLQSYYRTTKF